MPNHEPIEILLVEDNEGDARLALEALKKGKMRNNLYHGKDGVEAMTLLHNAFITKPLDLDRFVGVVQAIENFWFTIVKSPPRGDK